MAAIAMSGARGQDRGSTVLLAFAVAAALFLVLQLADFGYGRDQGIYATVARTLQTGGVPYRDAWDFKPPGIFFVYALAQRLFGMDVSAIRYVEALALCSLLPAAWILAKRYTGDGRAGILSTALAILIHVQSEFWDTAQPESFGAVCVVWALAVASGPLEDSRPERRRWGAWAVAGALYAAATVLKPTVGIAGIASLALAGLETRDSGGGSFGRIGGIVSAMAGGAAVVIGLTLAPFLLVGGFSDLVSALFVFAPQYTLVSAGTLGQSLARVLFEWFFWYSPANLVGLLLLALPPMSAIERRGIVHIGSAIVLLLLGVAVQQKFFLYHYGAVLPLTAVLAGWGYWKCWKRVHERWYALPVAILLLVALAAGRPRLVPTYDPFFARCALRLAEWRHPDARSAIRDRLYSLYDYVAADNRAAAEWIQRETPSNAQIYVWGFTPELYVASGRSAASRYIYNVPQRAPWSRESARAELMFALQAARPQAIVIERGDAVPHVTGTWSDSASELREFRTLAQFIGEHYRLSFRLRKFDVYTAGK